MFSRFQPLLGYARSREAPSQRNLWLKDKASSYMRLKTAALPVFNLKFQRLENQNYHPRPLYSAPCMKYAEGSIGPIYMYRPRRYNLRRWGCDMVLHQAFRARHVQKAASAVRCDMVLHRAFRTRHLKYENITPHLRREYEVRWGPIYMYRPRWCVTPGLW